MVVRLTAAAGALGVGRVLVSQDDIDAQLRGPHAELNQLALNEVTLIWWVLIAKQHDLPLVWR